jgi:hypothetical protein
VTGYDPTFELYRDDEPDTVDWGDDIPFDGAPTPTVILDIDGNEIKEGDAVQSPKTKRVYGVLHIKPNGRLVLYKHAWPRIKNAIPGNWRRLPTLEEALRG